MNKKISFPIAIIIIVVCAVLVGGIAIYFRYFSSIPEIHITPVISLSVFPTKEECEEKTGCECTFQSCDYAPPGKTIEEVCGKDFKKGWVCKKILGEGVTITTDKTKYEQGETIKITVKNNLDENIFVAPYGPVRIDRKLPNKEWETLTIVIPPPTIVTSIKQYTEINSNDVYEFEWKQKVYNLYFRRYVSAGIGTFRAGTNYVSEEKTDQFLDHPPQKEDFITIYSNEFTIK